MDPVPDLFDPGLFNILFAWLGLLCFFIPLIISVPQGTKGYCNRYCGRGQLFAFVGGASASPEAGHPRMDEEPGLPVWISGVLLRHVFLMLWNTWLVFAGAQDLRQVVTLLWTFKLPWHWAYHGTLFHLGVAQFAFGFYSVMLTSTVLGLVTMVLFKPRSWCVYCPMGTMMQLDLPGQTSNFITHHFRYMSKIILDIYQKLFYTGLNQSGTAQKRR